MHDPSRLCPGREVFATSGGVRNLEDMGPGAVQASGGAGIYPRAGVDLTSRRTARQTPGQLGEGGEAGPVETVRPGARQKKDPPLAPVPGEREW